MKLSSRLLSCAALVRPGGVAADVGTDHGHLAIHLLKTGTCPHVFATDLREMPLEAARRNASRFGVTEQMTFCRTDGVSALPLEEIDTVICAGMGGDTIMGIMEDAGPRWRPSLQWVLQPQSAVNDLRRWLSEQGLSVGRELLSRDGNFVYTAMEVRMGGGRPLSPGEQFLPPWLLHGGDPLLPAYFQRVKAGVLQSVQGLHRARNPRPDTLNYYESALKALEEMEEAYDLGK